MKIEIGKYYINRSNEAVVYIRERDTSRSAQMVGITLSDGDDLYYYDDGTFCPDTPNGGHDLVAEFQDVPLKPGKWYVSDSGRLFLCTREADNVDEHVRMRPLGERYEELYTNNGISRERNSTAADGIAREISSLEILDPEVTLDIKRRREQQMVLEALELTTTEVFSLPLFQQVTKELREALKHNPPLTVPRDFPLADLPAEPVLTLHPETTAEEAYAAAQEAGFGADTLAARKSLRGHAFVLCKR